MSERLTKIFLWGSLLVPPFLFLRSFPDVPELQKAFAVRAFLLAAFACAAFSVSVRVRVNKTAAVLIVLNLIWWCVSLVAHDITRETQLTVLDRYLALVALPLFAAFVPKGRGLQRLVIAVGLAAAAVAIFGFLNRYLPRNAALFPTKKLIATFTHPNLLAQYLAPVLPIFVALPLASPERFRRYFFLLLFPVVAAPFLLTYTRGAILAACFGSALTGLGALIASPKERRPWRTLGAIALMSAVCLTVLWSFDRPSGKRDVVLQEAVQATDIESSSLQNRIALWRQGWRTALEQPWIGCGPGRMQIGLALHRQLDDPEGRMQHKDVHQDLLQLAAEFGFPALLLFLGLLGILLKEAFRTFLDPATDADERIVRWALLCGAAVVFVHGLIDFPLSRSLPRLYAFAFLGMAAAPRLIAPFEGTPAWKPWRRALAFFALFGFVLGAGMIGLFEEGRAFLHFRDARIAARDKNEQGLRDACDPILADRGAGYARRSTCLGLLRKSLGADALPLADALAIDYPGHYQAAFLRARSYLAYDRPEAACAEIDRGLAIWWRNPAWKPLLERAIKAAGDETARRFCESVKAKLPAKPEPAEPKAGFSETEDRTGGSYEVP